MRDTPSSNRDPKLRADRHTDEVVLGEIAPEPIDCWFAGYRGVKGHRQPEAATQALRWPVAAGSDVIRFLRPERAEVEIIISDQFRSSGIFTARVLLERFRFFDWRLRHLYENSVQYVQVSLFRVVLRTLEAGGLCRGRGVCERRTGRTATTSHRSCHRDVRSWRRDCVRSVRRCNGELVMVGYGYKCTACSQRLRSSSY